MAAKLILSLDGMVIREYPLTKERTTIGRKPHNDIPIDNLAISGEHAMIMTILNDSFLEDLGSTNGTLVNGQPVKKHFLQNSDVVELGKYKLKYVSDASAVQAAPADFEKTMVLRAPVGVSAKADQPKAEAARPEPVKLEAAATGTGGLGTSTLPPIPKSFGDTVVNPEQMHTHSSSGTGSLREVARQAAAAAAASVKTTPPPAAVSAQAAPQPTSTQPGPLTGASLQGTIQILSGPSAGKELPLTKALTTLGKPGVQVAVIAKRPQGHFITHVEGASFPIVNGKQLDAQAHPLNDHDVIELAGVKMEFYLKP